MSERERAEARRHLDGARMEIVMGNINDARHHIECALAALDEDEAVEEEADR